MPDTHIRCRNASDMENYSKLVGDTGARIEVRRLLLEGPGSHRTKRANMEISPGEHEDSLKASTEIQVAISEIKASVNLEHLSLLLGIWQGNLAGLSRIKISPIFDDNGERVARMSFGHLCRQDPPATRD